MSVAKVFCIAHKEVPYGLPCDSVVKPLQVGFGERFCDLRDDDCEDNIAGWNAVFVELTAIYHIWKNVKADYKGQFQYRRRLPIDETTDFDELFKEHSVVTCKPAFFRDSVYQSYCSLHSKKDMELLEEIIRDLHPDYSENFDILLKQGRQIFYSNGFVMPAEEYDKYCEWLFGILWEFIRRSGWESPEDVAYSVGQDIMKKKRNPTNYLKYQMQICAFLSERLWTLYLQSNFPPEKVLLASYQLMENTPL